MSKKQPRRQKHTPLRSCVVCHRKVDKRQLTRVVLDGAEGNLVGAVIIDPTGKRNGRGAYLCDRYECWEQALTDGRILSQALRADIRPTDLSALGQHRPVVEPG